jgi:hypothetical protein
MMPDGDTTAHLRKQVGGMFLQATAWRHSFSGTTQAQGQASVLFEPFHSISSFDLAAQIARNEAEGWSFKLRCNTSRIVPDFVHALWSAYDDRSSSLTDTRARTRCTSRA